MTESSPDIRGVLVAVGFALLIGLPTVWVQTGGEIDANDTFTADGDGTREITCYKYVENGSATVVCPEQVHGTGWVNVSVLHCSEYEYRNDEPHPCEPWRENG